MGTLVFGCSVHGKIFGVLMTNTAHSCTNPGSTKLKGRRANLQKIWSGKEWKERKAKFLSDYPNCEMHKRVIIKGSPLIVPATVPHHPHKTSYKEGYSDLDLSQCVAYCNKCHFAIHHGLKLCEICGEHYHPWDAPMCKYCNDRLHPEIVAAREKFIQDKKDLQKNLRKEASEKAKAWKKAHPVKKSVKL